MRYAIIYYYSLIKSLIIIYVLESYHCETNDLRQKYRPHKGIFIFARDCLPCLNPPSNRLCPANNVACEAISEFAPGSGSVCLRITLLSILNIKIKHYFCVPLIIFNKRGVTRNKEPVVMDSLSHFFSLQFGIESNILSSTAGYYLKSPQMAEST